MTDNTIEATETVVDLDRQLLDLYQELSALHDFEDQAPERNERFDTLIASLKAEALKTIDDIRCLVTHLDSSNTDKASLILLLAISFAGEIRASESAKKQTASASGQTFFSWSTSDDRPRKIL